MIDFIRFYMLDKENFDFRTEKKKPVKLSSRFDIHTGEASEYPKNGKYFNMELKITEKSTGIKGSLHKMYNGLNNYGIQNYSDFTLCDSFEALSTLIEKFHIRPGETKLTNLEFGLNIPIEYDPKIFIDNSLLMFDFNSPSINEKFKNKGDYKEFKKSDYSLKIYNKSKQYKCSENLLRIEVKIINKRVLQRLNIFSLLDLMDSEVYKRLFEFLIEQFEQLLIIDSTIMRKALKTPEINMLKNYTNPHYWLNLKQRLSSNAYYKRKRKCNKYIEDFALNKPKKEIKNLMERKFNKLMDCNRNNYSMAA